jgi:predicted DNA-binding helix-hairpin-helix protein
VKLSNAKIAQGVFLSSGIAGSGIRTQDRIIATAELLRNKYGYKDYIHLKIMPGAEYDQIFRAMQLADRVSINLEGPGESYLRILSPHKNFLNELLELLRIVNTIRNNFPSHLGWNHHWPSSTTQFVVGAAGESDLDLLSMTENLTKNLKLSRSYFSRFTPVKNTPFENLPPLHALRQHRLYQASYLLRDYQFSLEDIQLGQDGNLSLEKDPKLTWAEHNLIERPIEINSAGYRELIKIPGVGPVIANKIIGIRKYGKIRDVQVLKKLGITIPRASRFILLDGYQPPFQEGLFYENP